MTFSIVGRCARTGMLGVAITTSSIAVGSRCPWVRAGTGAVATQNITRPSLGPDVLDRIERGETAATALDAVISAEPHPDYRQVTVVDFSGGISHFSGALSLGINAVYEGSDCIGAGNLLTSEALPKTMAVAFESGGDLHLAERLLRALEAGLYKAGGETGPVHSACLLVADHCPWPLVDLRVDWNDDDPVAKLRRLWLAYEPQMADYLARALDPASAPSYGVPGDE